MIYVCHNTLRDCEGYRRRALRSQFDEVPTPAGVFKGIGAPPGPEFEDWFHAIFPNYEATLTFLRKSELGQEEPNYIHTDNEMGDITAMLYLNPEPPPGDGTLFWRHRPTSRLDSDTPFWGDEGKDTTIWELNRIVRAQFNRALVFSSNLYHSRALRENYGEGDTARLTQVLFARRKP